MNGAESLVRTLVAGGVDVCFANPGTSEMHFVAALDRVEGMRCVLGLFEGVVTGAADGYSRMKGTPASTLAASRTRPCQRIGQSAQRQEGPFRHRQYRRPACDLSYWAECAADLRYRGAGAADVGLGPNLARRQIGRRGRCGRDRRGQKLAARDRDPDPPRGHRVERSRWHRRGAGSQASAPVIPPRPSSRRRSCCMTPSPGLACRSPAVR